MKSQNLRFYVKVRCKLGITAKEINNEIKSAIPDNALSRATVFRRYRRFNNGGEDLKITTDQFAQ